jgi:hypothetical protein
MVLMATDKMICSECMFWNREELRGQCRRYPPSVVGIGMDGQANTRFPMTHQGDWCGEFIDKDVPELRAIDH